MKKPDRKLVLENGTEFVGYGYGANRDTVCEVVFNTSVVGYQEIISDPSYTGQIVVMTYPMIGNYGITDEDFETKSLSIGGMVVRECCEAPSNFRYTKTLSEVLEEHNIPCIAGIDTRQLTRIIRDQGCQRAAIVGIDTSREEALALIASTPVEKNLVEKVSCRKRWYSRTPNHTYDVVAVDCGIKYNTVRCLNQHGCNVVIVPHDTSVEEIMAYNPNGLFISNGPGDPTDVPHVVKTIGQLRGRLPIFGIGLGHQLLALAYGARNSKLKSGHRGGYPVRDLESGRIVPTAQNHGYVIEPDSLAGTPLEVTHLNVVDGTIEGVECRAERTFSVQFHPEAAPGPQESAYLFDKFIKLMEEHRNA